jgi:hypothetical protein
VALGHCDATASAITARAFRTLLAARLGAALKSEVDTAAPLGGLATRTLADVQHAVAEARAGFYRDHVSDAASALEGLSVDVTRLPPGDARWSVEREIWTLLAQVRSKTSRDSAEAALRHVFRVEPDYRPDTSLYPPSFRTLADQVRKQQARAPTSRLDVAVSPAETDVYVDGRKLGKAPVSLRLPPGTYRVEADFGRRSLVRTVQVPVPPQLASPVELGAEVEGALHPDGGPCVDPGKEPGAALARATTLLGVDRLLGIHGEGPPERRVLVLAEVSRGGTEVREVRSTVPPGDPETEGLAALADMAVSGRTSPVVAVVGDAGPRAVASVEGHLVGQLFGTPPPTGFTLDAYGMELHSGRQTVHLGGVRYELTEIPGWRTVLHVTTDDGRVALAVAETGHGELRKDLTLEQPCTVSGRLLDEAGRPVGGARLFAALRTSGAWRSTRSGLRGHFVFKDLVRGDYGLLAGSVQGRIPLVKFSPSGTCHIELPAVVVPRGTLIGEGDPESPPRPK